MRFGNFTKTHRVLTGPLLIEQGKKFIPLHVMTYGKQFQRYVIYFHMKHDNLLSNRMIHHHTSYHVCGDHNGSVASSGSFPICSFGAALFLQYLVRLANETLKTTYKSYNLYLVWNI